MTNTLKCLCLIFCTMILFSCRKDDTNTPDPNDAMYFPPLTGNTWDTVSMTSLGWNLDSLQALKDYLAEKHTKSFMILVNGRIAMEAYFNGHNAQADWEWNSAGKTLVASAVGIAQQQGLLSINDQVSKYLGTGWSSAPVEKENLITIRNLLTMTSGLNDSSNLVVKKNLTYLADAGTRWAYSNVFQLLMDVVAAASHQDFDSYFEQNIKDKIGMEGYWNKGIIFTIYHSDTRSMARFGLLALNKGAWNGTQILNKPYFDSLSTSSQAINPSYGYLCWLNGKSSYMVPGSQKVFQGYLVPPAPAGMYAAMGASDQRVYMVPERNMVIVRMGDASDPLHPTFAVSGFDEALWSKINAVINK